MFREVLRQCGGLAEAQVRELEAHYRALCRWNRVLNLTRIEDVGEAVSRHYCESLFLAAWIPDGARVVDVGSGAGFPGFPLAVAKPGCVVTLLESHQRKAVFLKEVSRGIPNIRVVAKRAEDLEGSFDWVVSRAVGYEVLGKVVRRWGARLALLTGGDEAPVEWKLEWDSIAVPGGKQRYLRVSRETSSTFHVKQ